MAETFIPNPDNKEHVNHKDENKLNNSLDNLEWLTTKENINYGTRTIRMAKTRGRGGLVLLNNIWMSFNTFREAENILGIPRNTFGYKVKKGYYQVIFDDNNPYMI